MKKNRLPPGQQLVATDKWPIIGERLPSPQVQQCQLEFFRNEHSLRSFSLAELRAMEQTEMTLDIHCVTRWSKFDMRFSGVPLAVLLGRVGADPADKFVSFVAHSERNHSSSLRLDEALELNTLIALACDGNPLPTEHGGPIRGIVPGKYFYKSVKWVRAIELLPVDRLGFWEADSGYHNSADPWEEQRYVAPSISKREAADLIESRDFSKRDLRSIDVRGHDLTGLVAREAMIRAGDFSQCNLTNADFSRSNLSNASFRQAVLRGARFVDADLEGADFCRADLRGADLSGCSLFGASFCETDGGAGEPQSGARFDVNTKLAGEVIDVLTPLQKRFVEQQLRSGIA